MPLHFSMREKPKWHLAAFELHHRCGWSYAEIARLFNSNQGNVWWICHPVRRAERDWNYVRSPENRKRRVEYMRQWRAKKRNGFYVTA